MLIDSWRTCGLDALAQVDLGQRQNRHQPLRDLSAMAYAVLLAAQTRFLGPEFADSHACSSIILPPTSSTSEPDGDTPRNPRGTPTAHRAPSTHERSRIGMLLAASTTHIIIGIVVIVLLLALRFILIRRG